MNSHGPFMPMALLVILLWLIAIIGYIPSIRQRLRFPLGLLAFVLGWVILASYLVWLWQALERLPMRTRGETRLWFSLCVPLLAVLACRRWRLPSLLQILTLMMGIVFLLVNVISPELLDKSQMPALRSPLFAPHVISYIVGYASMGCAVLLAFWSLGQMFYDRFYRISSPLPPRDYIHQAHDVRLLVSIGMPFILIGMLLGAIWAQIAWGTYWGWDPKETWALISWLVYLGFIHLDRTMKLSPMAQMSIVSLAFVVILFCWYGSNSLPSAALSLHSYSSTQ